MIGNTLRTHAGRAALAVACLFAAVSLLAGCASDDTPLRCYVGGTMRPAMEELVRLYSAETGARIELDYGDSGSNAVKAETTGQGDLYVAHDPFHGLMQRKGLSAEGWAVASVQPMIAVAKGNPKGIHGLKDLARPGIRIILTDAMYSTAGHVVSAMVKRAGLAEAIEKNVVTRTRMGGEAANAVTLGHADAAIVWNAVVHLRREKLDGVEIEPAFLPDPRVDAVTSATFGRIDMSCIRVTVDLLKSSRRPEAARAFAQFCGSPRALAVWREFGFGLPPDTVHLTPDGAGKTASQGTGSLFVYCGAGLRPAMDEIAQAFTAKTGVTVERDYGGSGMIISRLRLAQRGDLFMPGDVWYVELAEKEGLVESKTMVCYFVPVILVRKGNPKNIRGLADLARPDVRLGIGNPKVCQVGRVTEEMIAKNHLDAAAIEKNTVFSATTVNELGLQVKAGQLDATIVWDAVAAQYPDSAEVVEIPPQERVISHVAIAVLKCSKNRDTAEAFAKFLLSQEGQAIFRKHQYRVDPPL